MVCIEWNMAGAMNLKYSTQVRTTLSTGAIIVLDRNDPFNWSSHNISSLICTVSTVVLKINYSINTAPRNVTAVN